MIWFSGFPFLDNKEEHIFNVPVSHAMTTAPLSLPASDFPIREAEHLLHDNKFQGFPIVEDRTTKTLLGYIGRTELRYAIDRARSESLLAPNAKCAFTKEAAEASIARRANAPQTGPTAAADTFDAIGADHVDFSRYVDHTPLTIHPRLPLETVMEIFKKMGPRVILIEHRGKLTGLVTVKDCLKYQFKVEAEEHALSATNSPGLALGVGSDGTRGSATGARGITLEDRVWGFLQWVGEKLSWGSGRGMIRVGEEGERSRRPWGAHSHGTGGLDGSDGIYGNVELEERDNNHR